MAAVTNMGALQSQRLQHPACLREEKIQSGFKTTKIKYYTSNNTEIFHISNFAARCCAYYHLFVQFVLLQVAETCSEKLNS